MKRLMRLTWPALCTALLLGPAANAAEQPATSGQQTAEQPVQEGAPVDSEAMAILNRMAEHLAQAERFSVTIQANYDVLQESGQKIEFGEHRTVMLSRPDRLRVESELSDGDQRLVVSDGKDISVLDARENIYAQVEKAGSVDEAVRYLIQNLQIRIPLAMMLVTTLPAELDRRNQGLDYVEENTLTEVPTDHLAGRTEEVDFQVWVPQCAEPLPRRIVLTYKHLEGEPQFRAVFSNWNLTPEFSESQFAFSPPQGAERIAFLVRVRKEDTVLEDTGAEK